MAPAYVISEVEILDENLANIYRRLAAASIALYGGRYLVRGGHRELIEGSPPPKAIVIVQFPSMEVAKEWYASPAYGEALKLGATALQRRLVFVEGVAP